MLTTSNVETEDWNGFKIHFNQIIFLYIYLKLFYISQI